MFLGGLVGGAVPSDGGAFGRSVGARGAVGVVRQARHAAPLDGATAKASAGAVNHVRIATVVNIARAIEELKAANVWTIGLDDSASETYDTVDYTVPTAFVVGAEGTGLRRLVRWLLYTSDAAAERARVDLGGRRFIKKKKRH